MTAIRITESELLTALRHASAVDDAPADAMTVSELRDALRVSRSTVHNRLTLLRKTGRLASYRVHRTDGIGRVRVVMAYAINAAQSTTSAKRKRA